jgi:MYXO-CTERM domain-containing protein
LRPSPHESTCSTSGAPTSAPWPGALALLARMLARRASLGVDLLVEAAATRHAAVRVSLP